MLLDDYITHLLETKLEKEDEKIYYKKINGLKKKGRFTTCLSNPQLYYHNTSTDVKTTATFVTRTSSSSESNSPIHSPEEESFEAVATIVERSDHSLEPYPTPTPMGAGMFTSGMTNNFRSNETSSVSMVSTTHGSFIPPASTSAHRQSVHSKAHTDYSSIVSFPSLPGLPDLGERTTRSSLQSFQPSILSPSSSVLRPPTGSDHLSPPVDFTVSQANLYSPTPQVSQQSHEQSSIIQVVPQHSLMPSTLKPNIMSHCTSYGAYSMSSTTPTFITQSSQATQLLPSCSLPISTPTQSYPSTTTQHHQSVHFGQQQQQQHGSGGLAPAGLVSDLSNASTVAHPLSSNMVGRSLPNLPGFAALNVPYSHGNPSTTLSGSTNSLSLFPAVQGMYPYTQFVGIPAAQLNSPFQMPGAQNQMPAGYPYIANVPHTLYNPQISTTTYSR